MVNFQLDDPPDYTTYYLCSIDNRSLGRLFMEVIKSSSWSIFVVKLGHDSMSLGDTLKLKELKLKELKLKKLKELEKSCYICG